MMGLFGALVKEWTVYSNVQLRPEELLRER